MSLFLVRPGIDLWQPITCSQSEMLIAAQTRRIQDCLLDTLERSGLAPGEIDAVVRQATQRKSRALSSCWVESLARTGSFSQRFFVA